MKKGVAEPRKLSNPLFLIHCYVWVIPRWWGELCDFLTRPTHTSPRRADFPSTRDRRDTRGTGREQRNRHWRGRISPSKLACFLFKEGWGLINLPLHPSNKNKGSFRARLTLSLEGGLVGPQLRAFRGQDDEQLFRFFLCTKLETQMQQCVRECTYT